MSVRECPLFVPGPSDCGHSWITFTMPLYVPAHAAAFAPRPGETVELEARQGSPACVDVEVEAALGVAIRELAVLRLARPLRSAAAAASSSSAAGLVSGIGAGGGVSDAAAVYSSAPEAFVGVAKLGGVVFGALDAFWASIFVESSADPYILRLRATAAEAPPQPPPQGTPSVRHPWEASGVSVCLLRVEACVADCTAGGLETDSCLLALLDPELDPPVSSRIRVYCARNSLTVQPPLPTPLRPETDWEVAARQLQATVDVLQSRLVLASRRNVDLRAQLERAHADNFALRMEQHMQYGEYGEQLALPPPQTLPLPSSTQPPPPTEPQQAQQAHLLQPGQSPRTPGVPGVRLPIGR